MAVPRTPVSCSGELEPPHAKAKGSECRNERKPRPQALAAGREQACRRVRRPAGRSWGACGSRDADGRKKTDAPFPSEPDLPRCEQHDPTGEPGAGKRHAGFGERGAETWLGERASEAPTNGESRRTTPKQLLPLC